MIAINNILVSDAVVQEHFVCNLSACKGMCCVSGDAGARLEKKELEFLEENYEKIKPFLNEEGKKAIREQGKFITDEDGIDRTPLVQNGACAYVIFENGIAKCGIEKTFEAKQIDFQKPISCHLFPIRIKKHDGYEAVNYEEWHICNPACTNGKKLKVRVFEFLKVPLIRKYGKEFFETLKAAVEYEEKK